MSEYCEICGDELQTEEETLSGICDNCSSTLMNDEYEEEQLFNEDL